MRRIWRPWRSASPPGAILQVILEVSLYLARRGGSWTGVLDGSAVAGIGAGLVIMYATTLLIQA